MTRNITTLGFSLALVLGAAGSSAYAQGRSGGHPGGGPPPGAGQPSGMGQPSSVGQPSGTGVDRGMGRASTNSNGRSDAGLDTASRHSNGRSDTGQDRARLASEHSNSVSDTDLNRYRGLSHKLGSTPEELRSEYRAALLANPDLKFGQFVSANVVADNLGTRYPGVTTDAILAGLANGSSLGQTLTSLGVPKDQAKTAQKDAETRMKNAKKND